MLEKPIDGGITFLIFLTLFRHILSRYYFFIKFYEKVDKIFEDEEIITITENHDDREQIEIVLDRAGKVLMKYVTRGDYVYIIEGDDVVSYTCNGEQQEITEEVLSVLKELMSTYELNNISDNEYFEYVNGIKTKIINAIILYTFL